MKSTKKKKEEKVINLFFIGDKFYSESGSIMSSIYVKDSFTRYDWGFVSIALSEGITINITPATDAEMLWAYTKLAEAKKKLCR